MLLPTTRLTRLAWAAALLAPLPAVAGWPQAWPGALPALALLVLAAADGIAARLAAVPALRREAPAAFALGRPAEVHLTAEGRGRLPQRCTLLDHAPAQAETTGLPASVRLRSGHAARISWQLRCLVRGDFDFGAVTLRLQGPLGLMQRQLAVPLPHAARVYPDFAAVAHYALLATDHRLSQLGVRQRRRRGEGLDFRQLREYRPGDPLRQVDWKATSRLNKPVSREYQDERDQQVMFLLDGGFRMRAQDGAISHFDAALNALLLLSWVALRQGDAAGAMTFAGSARHLAPRKGRAALSALMNGLYDLQPGSLTPDYLAVAREAGSRLGRRSLVVLMTNLREEDTADLVQAARLLGERHLVLVATLREQVLDEMAQAPVLQWEDAVRTTAARDFLAAREATLRRLAAEGVRVLDCTPPELPLRLVNSYLDVKRSGLL